MLGPIHHTGFIVRNLANAEQHFALLGYVRYGAASIEDDYQDAEIVFLARGDRRPGAEPLIELIRPRSERSHVYKFAKESKFRIHHLCFITEHMEAAVADARAKRFFQVTPVVKAPAIGDSLICFFFSREIGLFELVEQPPFQ